MRRWLALAVLLAGCSSAPSLSPEEAERQKVYEAALKPCKQKYPSIHEVQVDEYGRVTAETRSSAADLDGFKRCVGEALAKAAEKRRYGMGKLADKVGPTTVVFTPAGRLMYVSVDVNGVKGNLLLDTGATATTIRPSLAQKAGIELPARAPRMTVQVAGGERFSVPFVTVRSVAIGDAVVEGIDVGVTDVLLRGFPPQVDGILGTNYLNHFRMTIDWEGRLLVLDPVADPRQRLNRDRPL